MSNTRANNNYNFGDETIYGTTGIQVSEVADHLKSSELSTAPKCQCCAQPASVRVIPKDSRYLTAELQRGVYFCDACLSKNPFNKDIYGVRPVSP